MKKLIAIIMSMFMMSTVTACGSDSNNPELPENENEGENTEVTNGEVLIVYFSRKGETYPNMEVLNVGHTANMAKYIQEYTGGVLFEIEPEIPYEDPYSSVLERSRQEIDNNARPAIKNPLENIDRYSVVFVGCPIWYGRPPMIIQTFYEAYPELANKSLVPFGTHEGSGISSCTSTMRQYFPNATLLEAFGLRGQEVNNSRSNVETWLGRIGVPKKE